MKLTLSEKIQRYSNYKLAILQEILSFRVLTIKQLYMLIYANEPNPPETANYMSRNLREMIHDKVVLITYVSINKIPCAIYRLSRRGLWACQKLYITPTRQNQKLYELDQNEYPTYAKWMLSAKNLLLPQHALSEYAIQLIVQLKKTGNSDYIYTDGKYITGGALAGPYGILKYDKKEIYILVNISDKSISKIKDKWEAYLKRVNNATACKKTYAIHIVGTNNAKRIKGKAIVKKCLESINCNDYGPRLDIYFDSNQM